MWVKVLPILTDIIQTISVVGLAMWCGDLGDRIRRQRLQVLEENSARRERDTETEIRISVLERQLEALHSIKRTEIAK